MRNNENNIIFNVRNITLNLKNITTYFTGKEKIITLVSVIMMLSFTNITLYSQSNFVSALSYSSNVNVGFTFNPVLNISLSSSDLTISNLTPGSTSSSNEITVNVATNAANGYTLSATVGNNSTYNTDSLINSVDNNKVFSNIATDANLSLSDIEASESTNIWGYSYKDNTLATPAWSNYNGLPLYSSTGVTLIGNNNIADSTGSIDFKIAAKASSTQASGVYNNVINFAAVPKIVPLTLLESFIAHNATQYNSYFTMQGMTPEICKDTAVGSSIRLIDVRDSKFYWVAKLADNNCWMTQNLDLDLSSSIALTSETSDINPATYNTGIYTSETGYTIDETTGIVSWLPSTIDSENIQRADTIVMSGNTASGWTNNNNNPYSADPGERYKYTNPTSYSENTYTSLAACASNNDNDTVGCEHSHFGNYYNWSAAAATNDASTAPNGSTWSNSVCPKNWDLPANGKYGILMQAQNIWSGSNKTYASKDSFNLLRISPLYFQRFGVINNSSLGSLGDYGNYWSSTIFNANTSGYLFFSSSTIWPNRGDYYGRSIGFPVRCMINIS